MLAHYEFSAHNDVMIRGERSPAEKEVYSRNPDWSRAAWLIADQPGCENFPVSIVNKILSKPGELIVGALPHREDSFAIGAIIAAKERPFSPLAVPNRQELMALGIQAEAKKYAEGYSMYAERSISFGLTPGTPGDIPNYMGPGIHREGKSPLTVLAADEPAPELAIGTDEVNAFFQGLASEKRLAPHKDRLVGMLFQVARLAMDFNAPTPVAPEELQPEVLQAKAYYQAAQALAQRIAGIRKDLQDLEERLTYRSVISRPAILFEKPLELPAVADVQELRRRFTLSPTDNEIRHALHWYGKAIETLDILRTE